ncbi:uncharacterized protein LOC123311123 [Coccinella septempunctata]|uniref:uncharacterized protein LOC123311123 n=1 Tax=Coccinella septempunctata TaxID=41139 RepID=UPI001D06481D|nr:uncharacterized protein LOC123311123 [Coccinella septempunctata]
MNPVKSLMKEKQRLEDLSDNLNEEMRKYEALRNTPYPYQLWQRIPRCNLKLQELKPNYYFDAINVIEEYYLNEEPLFQNMGLVEDCDSSKSFRWRVLNNLKNSTSVIALNEGNLLEIAGVLVLVEVTRNYFSRNMSREDLVQGHCHKMYVKLTSTLIYDVDLYSMFDCFIFLRIYALCIKPNYRHMGLGLKFFETAIYVAQSLRIPVIMGVFTDSCLQVLARKIGMTEIKKIKYSDWKDFDNNEIFPNLRQDRTSCSLMAGRVPLPPPPPVTETIIVEEPRKKKK